MCVIPERVEVSADRDENCSLSVVLRSTCTREVPIDLIEIPRLGAHLPLETSVGGIRISRQVLRSAATFTAFPAPGHDGGGDYSRARGVECAAARRLGHTSLVSGGGGGSRCEVARFPGGKSLTRRRFGDDDVVDDGDDGHLLKLESCTEYTKFRARPVVDEADRKERGKESEREGVRKRAREREEEKGRTRR